MEIQRPLVIYGITKVHLELMGEYYHHKHRVDFRSLRIPNLISETMPGGGVAAFMVTMLYDLLKNGKCVVPVSPKVRIPLIYITDLIRGIEEFMEADNKRLRYRTYVMASAGVSSK